ncbi:FAD-dependent thymidylate synthase [Deferribacterales bacterium Es71-Z0220]|uniref:FAD-dependent thymidylate synthase n=1 Tax=Deferrivibrio essentukiensis TaxID=2880922 RepID=UPI001F6081FD|nr:FAD-dependent thymidylate synthase [Deferrivibrio essentukiensis]MBZ4672351.1 thymidylate synthase [Deferribacteraceae bacterium]MCB4203737.1 FAD-dependent thymidylate synthase [Deferrivibrio essentukiensis]
MVRALSKNVDVKVCLLRHTFDPENLAALAAKLCYTDSDIDGLSEKLSKSDVESFIEKIVRIGHHSVLEHVSFSFGIEGVSRALTHQLVRHRIASYSQKSQRYVKHKDGFEYVFPDTIKNSDIAGKYEKLMGEIASFYDELVSLGIPSEDARYVLPNACETKIIVTMNARELLHFFRIRCCNRAQWEIRKMAEKMLEECIKVAPSIFSKAGPGCVFGPCPENEFTCGKASEVREKYKKFLKESGRLN